MDTAKLPVGILIYGVIEEIGDFELKFCVTGGISVKVPITNISRAYTNLIERFTNDDDNNDDNDDDNTELAKLETMFQIGDYYPVKIIAKNSTSQYGFVEIIGSINPSDIYEGFSSKIFSALPTGYQLFGAVSTIEDYGYGIDLGVETTKGFLSFDEHKKSGNSGKLNIGQPVSCAILKSDERSIQLTNNKKKIGAVLDFESQISITNYVPGTRTQVTVTTISKTGLELSLPGEYKGFVSKTHISDKFSDAQDSVTLNETYEGTVLYVQPLTKQVCISLQSSLTKKIVKSFLSSFRVGMVLKNVVMVGKGMAGSLIFRINGQHYAYCRRKNLAEAEELEGMDVDKRFPINSHHVCKVKSFNLFDNLVEISLKKSFVEKETIDIHSLSVLQTVDCTVRRHDPKGIFVTLGPKIDGFVPNKHLTDAPFKNMNMEKLFPLKGAIKCRILKLDTTLPKPRISLTMKKTLMNMKEEDIFQNFEDITPGMSSTGVVGLVQRAGILVEFWNSVAAFIPLKNLATYKIDHPEKVFSIGQLVKVTIVHVSPTEKRMVGTLIDIVDKKNKGPKDPAKSGNSKLQIGQILRRLKVSKDAGSEESVDLVNNEGTVKVFLPIGHVDDDPEVAEQKFRSLKAGDSIDKVMVFRKDLTGASVTVTMKKVFLEKAEKKEKLVKAEDDIELRVSFPAVVRNVTENGVFFEIPGGNCGVMRRKYLKDNFYDEADKLGLKKNQTITVSAIESVLATAESEENKDPKKASQLKRFKFSMKASDTCEKTEEPVVQKAKKDEKKLLKEEAKKAKVEERRAEKKAKKAQLRNERRLQKILDIGNGVDPDQEGPKPKKSKKNKDIVEPAPQEFQWDIPDPTPNLAKKRKLNQDSDNDSANHSDSDMDNNNNDFDDDDTESMAKKRKTKDELREERKQRETDLREKEESLTDPSQKLKSEHDFEMAIIAQPNSSMIWLKFMSFYLEKGEYDKARQVGDRALEKISFRETKEKLNVWIGLLNLENTFGDADSLEKVLQKALQYNDPKSVYLQLASIYELSEKPSKAEETFQVMLKKFKQDKTVWSEYLTFLMKGEKIDQARKAYQRSLISLPKRDHVDVISKFAQLEFRLGDSEQAKTIFEQMLGQHWKRLDQWSVYIDMLIKYTLNQNNSDSMEYIRNVFERLISFKLSPERMKFVFKKYYDFEAKSNEEGSEVLERIRQKAKEYVEKPVF